MNKLSSDERARVLMCLVEGSSINATARMTGVAHTTILRLIREVGSACKRFHDAQVHNLSTERVQCDEVWSFCYAKQKNLPEHMWFRDDVGSIWTWTALDADSKLLIAWNVGSRSLDAARVFIRDLSSRLGRKVQLTTDGRSAYLTSLVEIYDAGQIDYSVLMKFYGPSGNQKSPESRYSPGRLAGIEKQKILGDPKDEYISTSFMERWNLTLRMQNRRFTRLTNAFSKKLENHKHMLAITMVFYNFCRKHKSLGGKTPAMVAGLTDYVWTAADMLALNLWHTPVTKVA